MANDAQLHSVQAELLRSKFDLRAHEALQAEYHELVECLSDALVAALSLLNASELNPRTIDFAGDIVAAIRRAFTAVETSSKAHERLIHSASARLDERTKEVLGDE